MGRDGILRRFYTLLLIELNKLSNKLYNNASRARQKVSFNLFAR